LSRLYLVEFATPQEIVQAVAGAKQHGLGVLDALTPFPIPELSDEFGHQSSPIRGMMAAAGFGMAILAFALQYYSAVFAYPLNSGGRPLNSWPVFLLVSFEVGVLAAAIAGFATFLWCTGLPRLHHPLFALPNIERASQDRFFLLVDGPAEHREIRDMRRILAEAGALSVGEVGP
jgi:hypothetical protein